MNSPVILVHLEDEKHHPGHTACTGDSWSPVIDDTYRAFPRVLCVACERACYQESVYGVQRVTRCELWEDSNYQVHLRKNLRSELLEAILDKSCVPVTLPVETLFYQSHSVFNDLVGHPVGSDVPPEAVARGADWDHVIVRLHVRVRKPS